MSERAAFVAWLRSRRSGLVGGPRADEALETLGLDDAHLHRWERAERQITTLPHASPNVFFPRVGVAWFARHLQRVDPAAVHVRVALTHVNFSDLGWRPYAWWRLDASGALQRDSLFTRNKRRKHVVVASQAPLREAPAGATGVDARAAKLATAGTDRATSYMLIMASVERAAGLVAPGRGVYVPLHLVLEYVRVRAGAQHAVHGGWMAGLVAAAEGRRIGEDGRLVPADPRTADVFDNATNIAALGVLGDQDVIGGGKMAAYWPDVAERGDAAARGGGTPGRLHPVRLPDVDLASVVAPSPGVRSALDEAGVEYSQGMALAEHGAFGDAADPYA